jgi:hypothetical protein
MRAIGLATALALLAAPAVAQENAGKLGLELNALQPSDKGCRVTFLATNDLGVALTKSAFEIALFGASGAIERLVALDFKAMPSGKTKVMQFDLDALDCTGVSRVLVNDVSACEGDGLDPATCLSRLSTSTKTEASFGI